MGQQIVTGLEKQPKKDIRLPLLIWVISTLVWLALLLWWMMADAMGSVSGNFGQLVLIFGIPLTLILSLVSLAIIIGSSSTTHSSKVITVAAVAAAQIIVTLFFVAVGFLNNPY